MGSLSEKIKAIERVDHEVLAPLRGERRRGLLVLPDHLTPLRTRTHDGSPVPFAFARGDGALLPSASPAPALQRVRGRAHGVFVDDGPALMRMFLAATG